MFLQMHTLTSFHASLLNRDDAGLAKTIPFGDASRLRVSSQCLKKHWRDALQENLNLPDGLRTREFFSREVKRRLTEEKGVTDEFAHSLVLTLAKGIIKSKGSPVDENTLRMEQPALFGKPEADFFVALLAECAEAEDEKAAKALLAERLKTDKKGFNAMLSQAGHGNLYAGFEGALFGRFVTSDILARSDAAVHVAHALSVHPVTTEVDYFTVVDDLNKDEETGAAHAGDMELGSGLFYEYVAVDIPLLVSNFTACEPKVWRKQNATDVKTTLKALLKAIATVTPGAKLGATAPYARADFVLFESGCQQPRSLANAYLQSLRFQEGDDPMQRAVDALGGHLQAVDGMYGVTADQRVAATTKESGALAGISVNSLDAAIDETLNAIFGA
ncbi:type I-E CRISPR-associated protein Cas7/Cse4/CasC [endosymbiont of Lamellibrachia barhami]|uniref:type I-E CRISPR-associated protein Cas7/Cse4/CasC n=1 Tax=endosymbiont of Lamellibrachia barhami TaxID=205975 RepID=UPI0015ADD463|nr:type I-E CRISPR-associated protein Cas7/Cse4/CasC [endosymbiont of Lamellibrachia barhami]